MTPPGELVFREACKAPSLGKAVADLPDGVLRELIAWLEIQEPSGVAGEVWAHAASQAKERFMKGAPHGMTFPQVIADAASEAETLKTVFAVITPFVVAVLGAVGCRHYRKKGREEGRASANVTIEGQPIEVRQAHEVATVGALQAAAAGIKQEFRDVWDGLHKEGAARGQEIDQLHTRMNSAFRKLDRLDGIVEGIETLVGKLLDIQLHRPEGTTAREQRAKRRPKPIDD